LKEKYARTHTYTHTHTQTNTHTHTHTNLGFGVSEDLNDAFVSVKETYYTCKRDQLYM
jgi:hypothetical protein